MAQELHYTDKPLATVERLLAEMNANKVFLLFDENTERFCGKDIDPQAFPHLGSAHRIVITPGDESKNIDTLSYVWSQLVENGATRNSLLVNIGGGMVTDLGGFAAATFKRGIRFMNVPTTLLGAVDAAVGGKTGINFCGLKNEIGAFCEASHVVISPKFYATLPADEVISGYGEVIKHGLLNSRGELAKVLAFDVAAADAAAMMDVLRESVEVKRRIVAADPTEKGLRKALNLGHTVGHAFEALAMERGEHIAHGVAVAQGLVADLVLSHLIFGFPSEILHQVVDYVKSNYPAPRIDCKDYPQLIELMRHDKKNSSADSINFSLLAAPGEVKLDTVVGKEQIEAALDIMRDLLGVA